MNPLEYTDAVLKIQENKILSDEKTEYTKDEVLKIIEEMNLQQKKAIFNSDFIFDVEFINGDTAVIKDEEYTIKKMLVDNEKYVIFLQTSCEDVEMLRSSVSEILKVSSNILGVFIVSSKDDIGLVTAKLKTPVNDFINYMDLDYTVLNTININYSTSSSGTNYYKYSTKSFNYT